VLLPPFTPAAVARHEERTRGICRELIAKFDAKGCDGAEQYAQEIPPRVIAHMLGIREDDGDLFRKWIYEVLELGTTDVQAIIRASAEMGAYFANEIAKRRAKPTDDLISYLLSAKAGDKPLTDEHIDGTLRLLLIAGIDTTWSAIGSCLWHLARVPQDRERLVNEPQLMNMAVEEFLRAYAPVTMAREVVKETTVNGCPMKEGQMVLLSFPAANRDPTMFSDADKVVLDRKQNPHAAFGLGIHRCVGSNLARMEIKVALEEFLKAKPVFRLDTSQPMKWSQGTVRGPRRLPILFG
jgi:cytochrome P450